MIAVLVASHLFNARNDYVLNVLAELFVAFNLGSCVGHSVAIFFNFNSVSVDEIIKPFNR